MTKFLLGIGLIVTPYFTVPGIDVRDIKLTVASVVAITLCLAGLYLGKIGKLNNKWFYLFLGYALTCFIVAPNPRLEMLNMNVGNFWVWQPMYNFLLFGLMILVIAGMRFTRKEVNVLIHIMVGCGLIMGIYVIFQALSIDQFFDSVGHDGLGKIAGTIGNHTHVSPFIAMLVPLALYIRRYVVALVMIVAVVVTTSQVAIGALLIGLLGFISLKSVAFFKHVMLGIILFMCVFLVMVGMNVITKDDMRTVFQDHQRLEVYTQVVKDVNVEPFKNSNQRYPFTGWGMGNFKYTFHFAHSEDQHLSPFLQAHCDPLELLYDTGIIGFALFSIGLFVFFKQKAIRFYNVGLGGVERALLSGFIIICITACGTFIWQIGTTVFYSCVFFGLLNNEDICKNKREICHA